MGKLKRETTRARAAFNVYAAMGPGRSIARLHAELKTLPEWATRVPSVRYIEEWSASHRWQDRCQEYDQERAEERRIARESLKEKTNEEHFVLGKTAAEVAVEQIQRLINVEKFGSQASVQLLKIATDLQRLSLGLDRPEADKGPQQAGIQIIIETDNRPVEVGAPPKVVDARIVSPLPALPAPAPVIDAGPVFAVESDDETGPEGGE